jgi:hypothetical protein
MVQRAVAKDGRPRAAREAEQRRSRRRVILIIVSAVVIPIAATFLFIGSERVQGVAVAVLALWLVTLAFIALFQRPIAKSGSTWSEPPDTGYGG